jgi:hypothetical protein
MSLPKDWIELLHEFDEAGVEYLVVGAHTKSLIRPSASTI